MAAIPVRRMLPLKDTIQSHSFPLVNTMLIGGNILAFLYELSLGPGAQRLIQNLGVIPHSFLYEHDYYETATLFTSMFLHAGWLHLLSNMLALYIFGDNVEDRLGSVRYLLFYLACGVGAGLTHIVLNSQSQVPTIGASGAIAGVLGAYLVLYPRARVITLIPIFFIPWLVEIPALVYLGFWFFLQLFNGAAAVVSSSVQTNGGVAWWAHAGGFVVGIVLVFLFAPPRRRVRRQYVDEYYPW